MSRARYLALRTLQTIVLMWLALSLIFLFFRFMPGNFTDYLVYQGATETAIEQTEEKWGLNDPIHIQYWSYVTNFVVGEFGTSFQANQPVWDFVNTKVFNTLILAVPGITTAYIIGGILGSYIGNNRGSRSERSIITLVTMFGTLPSFFSAILAVILFATVWNIFPAGGMVSVETTNRLSDNAWYSIYFTVDFLRHYILPFLTIVLIRLLAPTLVMRTSTVEVMGQDFAYFQKVSGLPYLTRMRHMSRHAILPLITQYPISLVNAVSSLVLVELVFNWPGIGWTLIQSVSFRDFPVVQFIFFAVAATVILANFFIDILYGIIDPRITVGES